METDVSQQGKHSDLAALPPDALRQLVQLQEGKIQAQEERIKKINAELEWFRQQFKLAQHRQFAKSSEKQETLQPSLFDEDEDCLQQENKATAQTETITYTRTKSNRPNKHLDTSKLPRERHIIDLEEAQKQCDCGCQMVAIGEETKEEIQFKPAQLKVIEHVRIKYTCRQCESIKTPPAVALPIAKSKASAGLLAEVIINKYRFHLPLYRQRKVFLQNNIDIPDSTLGGWVMQSASQLAPLGEAFWDELAYLSALQVDETPVKILNPEKKAYMWVYHSYVPGKRFIIFDFNLNRSAKVVDARLKDFKGLLQTDGFSGYNSQRARKDIINIGCWDHARRKFSDVIKANGANKAGKAGEMLKKIAKLYELESELKSADYPQRQAVRQEKAVKYLENIFQFLQRINAPPDNLLGTAVIYAKNQWPQLIAYVKHGEAELSNCWVENQIRPFAVGKRNWLFVGNEISAQRGALLYSLIQSAELNDIDPRQYLIYVLNHAHEMRRGEINPADLLPHRIDKNKLPAN